MNIPVQELTRLLSSIRPIPEFTKFYIKCPMEACKHISFGPDRDSTYFKIQDHLNARH